MQTATKTRNPISWLYHYLRESREEMRKVTWPARDETIKYSALVIGISVVVAAFFGGLDWLLNLGLEELIKLTS